MGGNKRIKAICMDVDGVLTDGSILYDSEGREIKSFNVQDGIGIRLALKMGLKVYFISNRTSETVSKRAKELGIQKAYQGLENKKVVIEKIMKKEELSPSEVAFIGDDIVDIPAMKIVGFPIAVANARPEVKKQATFVTRANGGNGAVREAIELILKQQDYWKKAISEYVL